jgi:Dolichyl-phosphate-mannose-protein mannosyltransferase
VAGLGSASKARPKKVGAKKGWSSGTLFGATAILVYLALLKLLLHLLTAENYGYFRDEFYYIIASQRPDLGYVDFPPFVVAITAATRGVLGDSLLALHVLPALAGAVMVVLTGLMARELGGGRYAQGIAALATLVAPNILAYGAWLSMDAFDQLFWVSAAYVLILILNRERPRLWLLFGLLTGLGLFTKVTMLYFGFAVFVTLLATPARRHLRTRWPWLGGAVALVFLLPYLYWQVLNGWPTLEFWGNYYGNMDPDSLGEFFIEQTLTMQPISLPLWLAGLCFFLFGKPGKPFRVLGLAYVILFAIFAIQNAKFYFLAPAYPMLFAAGGVALERFFGARRWGWPKPVYAVVLAVTGAAIAVFSTVPTLPVETVTKINGTFAGVHIGIEGSGRSSEVDQLPLNFADRLGWEDMVGTVAGVRDRLPPEEQSEACVLTRNYGEAAAVDFFGPKYGLPKAISGHNNYYLWGTRGCTGEVVLSVGIPLEQLETVFGNVEEADEVRCEYCMPDENNFPVYVSRDPKRPFEEAWPEFKHYN